MKEDNHLFTVKTSKFKDQLGDVFQLGEILLKLWNTVHAKSLICRVGNWDATTSGHLRRMLMPGVNWQTKSYPLVIGSLKTDYNTKFEPHWWQNTLVWSWSVTSDLLFI